VNKDLLELWGQTLLEMAKIAKGPKSFFDLFQDGLAKETEKPDFLQEQFLNLCRRMFGKEGIEAFNAVLKEFYENVGVVPRAQYNELHEKFADLKKKFQELESKIAELKKKLEGGKETPTDLMDQWTETVKRYAEINQKFFEEFSKFFKP
jgi:chromosome segregation ATPase